MPRYMVDTRNRVTQGVLASYAPDPDPEHRFYAVDAETGQIALAFALAAKAAGCATVAEFKAKQYAAGFAAGSQGASCEEVTVSRLDALMGAAPDQLLHTVAMTVLQISDCEVSAASSRAAREWIGQLRKGIRSAREATFMVDSEEARHNLLCRAGDLIAGVTRDTATYGKAEVDAAVKAIRRYAEQAGIGSMRDALGNAVQEMQFSAAEEHGDGACSAAEPAKVEQNARRVVMSERTRIGDDLPVSVDEALKVLPKGDTVHTFLGRGGCDMDRPRIVEAIEQQKGGTLSDAFAWAGHYLRVVVDGRTIHVETDPDALVAVLEARFEASVDAECRASELQAALDAEVDAYLSRIEEVGLEEDALDDLVLDCVMDQGIDDLNAAETPEAQEACLEAREAAGAAVNNEGVAAQVRLIVQSGGSAKLDRLLNGTPIQEPVSIGASVR